MQIGIIGLGDMGKLYATTLAKAGYRVYGADQASRNEALRMPMEPHGVEVLADGHEVVRRSDFLIFCVEAEQIGPVVETYARSVKYGAIVSGQTSVKHPEIRAFEQFLPDDAHVVTCHSLHGPAFQTEGQSLIVIRHRAIDEKYEQALTVYRALRSNIIELENYLEHDKIMADTQAVTHMGFESMGTAWKTAGFFPWDNGAYANGIDSVKILTTLRIFSYKSHIYAGLALLNPFAKEQVRVYATCEAELFRLMICEEAEPFREKIDRARASIFGAKTDFLLFDDETMKAFTLSQASHRPNSHLSILSMVYTWHQLGINPYANLICQTPPFKLRLGIAEYLFRHEDLLEESIQTALYDKSIRADDLAFHTAVHEWASIIELGDLCGYKEQFEATKSFFAERLQEGLELSTKMISQLM